MATQFAHIAFQGRPVAIEYVWVGRTDPEAPVMVFLHEGLGSVSMWRDYPQQLCDAAGMRGLVFSRYGYGQSTPRPPSEEWQPDFMHRQAHEAVPAFLQSLGLWDLDLPALVVWPQRRRLHRPADGQPLSRPDCRRGCGGAPFVCGRNQPQEHFRHLRWLPKKRFATATGTTPCQHRFRFLGLGERLAPT